MDVRVEVKVTESVRKVEYAIRDIVVYAKHVAETGKRSIICTLEAEQRIVHPRRDHLTLLEVKVYQRHRKSVM
jgi:predicted RNA binding protein with dsRBD fold (UPF0201 family)